MKNSKAISIIKNFPSNDICKEDKKEALSILVSTNIVHKLTKMNCIMQSYICQIWSISI